MPRTAGKNQLGNHQNQGGNSEEGGLLVLCVPGRFVYLNIQQITAQLHYNRFLLNAILHYE